jgi:hypothetical protein
MAVFEVVSVRNSQNGRDGYLRSPVSGLLYPYDDERCPVCGERVTYDLEKQVHNERGDQTLYDYLPLQTDFFAIRQTIDRMLKYLGYEEPEAENHHDDHPGP